MSPDQLPIDWSAAVTVGIKAAPSGPKVTAAQAADAVRDLRIFSREAELAVREVTTLGLGLPVLDGDVVDRPGWITATAQGMEILARPMTERIIEQTQAIAARSGRKKHSKPGVASTTAASAPIGAILGYLSGKVLGQFDPFTSGADGHQGRLLLVAPNIIKVERELDADPTDFRMWVCLHESTHRLQFTAVPWMREYFRGLIAEFAAEQELDSQALIKRLTSALRNKADKDQPKLSMIESTQTPAQREVFDKLMAMMTLLEGHADYVMDAVGPQVVPSVAQIRRSFTTRRGKTVGPIDRIFRRLLGMDMKMRQYVQGGAFVHAVVDQVGMSEFNTIWAGPETLPTRAEVTDPAAWVKRVLG